MGQRPGRLDALLLVGDRGRLDRADPDRQVAVALDLPAAARSAGCSGSSTRTPDHAQLAHRPPPVVSTPARSHATRLQRRTRAAGVGAVDRCDRVRPPRTGPVARQPPSVVAQPGPHQRRVQPLRQRRQLPRRLRRRARGPPGRSAAPAAPPAARTGRPRGRRRSGRPAGGAARARTAPARPRRGDGQRVRRRTTARPRRASSPYCSSSASAPARRARPRSSSSSRVSRTSAGSRPERLRPGQPPRPPTACAARAGVAVPGTALRRLQPAVDGVQLLPDHPQRQVLVALRGQHEAQPGHIVAGVLAVAGRRPLRLDQALGLQEPQLGDGDVRELRPQLAPAPRRCSSRRGRAPRAALMPAPGRPAAAGRPSSLPARARARSPSAASSSPPCGPGDEHQPELADLHLVAVAQRGRLDPLPVDVRAVEAAHVAHGERRRPPGGTRRAGGTPSRRRGRCRCRGAGRWWSRRGRAGTGRPRSGPRARPAAPCRAAARRPRPACSSAGSSGSASSREPRLKRRRDVERGELVVRAAVRRTARRTRVVRVLVAAPGAEHGRARLPPSGARRGQRQVERA